MEVGEPSQVRNTGDWSSNSKLASIKNGYWTDPYFEALNKSEAVVPNRAALICRGYYVRFAVCDYVLRKMLLELDSRFNAFQLVSLGCGMDSTFFRLLPQFGSKVKFFEVDFPSVIAKKQRIIESEGLGPLAEGKLFLIPGDLRELPALQSKLLESSFDPSLPTLFYSECVVNYLRPNQNQALLSWIVSNVPKSCWLAYEQCSPEDSFGRIMVSHFRKNGCPIFSLERFDDMRSQERQLHEAGFQFARVLNAWTAFQELGAKIHQTQIFDEYEAFLHTCQHYSVRMAGNLDINFDICKNTTLNSKHSEPNIDCVLPLEITTCPWSCLRSGHASALLSGRVFVIGGFDETFTRVPRATVISLDESQLLEIKNKCFERVHSAVAVFPKQNHFYIFGGRKSPSLPCDNQLIKVNMVPEDNGQFTFSLVPVKGPCPTARWRHALVATGQMIYLFGGKNENETLEDFWVFDVSAGEWSSVPVRTAGNSPAPTPRHSHSMCASSGGKSLFIVGGISGNNVTFCPDSLWEYDCDEGTWSLREQSELAVKKFGHTATVFKDELIVLGGAGLIPVEHFVAVVDLSSGAERFYKLELEPDQLFLPFGFTSVLLDRSDENYDTDGEGHGPHLKIIGGGGNCFSFGTHFNNLVLEIKLPLS